MVEVEVEVKLGFFSKKASKKFILYKIKQNKMTKISIRKIKIASRIR